MASRTANLIPTLMWKVWLKGVVIAVSWDFEQAQCIAGRYGMLECLSCPAGVEAIKAYLATSGTWLCEGKEYAR